MNSISVAIVDDAEFIKILLRKMLEEEGYHIIGEGSNGLDAIELIKNLKPDIMILDITMPDMDGITALKEIMTINDKTQIIICSALKENNLIKELLKLGASDFIIKPFEKSTIITAIQNAVRKMKGAHK